MSLPYRAALLVAYSCTTSLSRKNKAFYLFRKIFQCFIALCIKYLIQAASFLFYYFPFTVHNHLVVIG